MMAVEVREYPSISTRSKGMAASERPSRMASPLRPPANPAARTGTSRVRRERATFTPLPPASVMVSGALCLWPRVRLGTTSVLATAALRVTVSIMTLPTPIFYSKIPPRYTTSAARARLLVALFDDQRSPPDLSPIDLHDDQAEPGSCPCR